MQSANPKPGKLDMLSQHAVEANHRCGKLEMLSQHTPSIHTTDALSKHTLQKLNCIKEATKAQNSGQADTATSCAVRRTIAKGTAEQAATTP